MFLNLKSFTFYIFYFWFSSQIFKFWNLFKILSHSPATLQTEDGPDLGTENCVLFRDTVLPCQFSIISDKISTHENGTNRLHGLRSPSPRARLEEGSCLCFANLTSRLYRWLRLRRRKMDDHPDHPAYRLRRRLNLRLRYLSRLVIIIFP